MDLETKLLINNNEDKASYNALPFRVRIAFGVGHVLNDICSSIWFSYLLVFLHLVLGFDNNEAGFIVLVGQVADAVANPFVGYQSDQRDSLWLCRYGKRKIWHLLGTMCVVMAIPFVFARVPNAAESHKWAQLFYLSVFTAIFQFGWAAVQISHLSLIPELTPVDNHRTKLVAIRYCFTVLSNVFVYLVAWGALGVSGESNKNNEGHIGPEDAPKFQIIVWAGIVVGVLCTIIFHVFIKEKDDFSNNNEETQRPSISVSEILTNTEYYQAAVIYMSTMLFVNLSQVFIPLYLHESLDMAARALAVIPLIVYLGSFVTSLIVERVNKYLGRKIAYVIGSATGLVACIWVLLRSELEQFVVYEIGMVALLFGIGSSIILVTNLGITSDVIGDKTGSGAFIYGIMCFSDKLANGIAVFLIQYYHNDTKMYYRNVLAFVCGGALLLGTLAVILLPKKEKNKREYTRLN